jgi:hypothetical protein
MTIESAAVSTTIESSEGDCFTSSRRLDDLSDLLTMSLSGRVDEPQALKSEATLKKHQAPRTGGSRTAPSMVRSHPTYYHCARAARTLQAKAT